MTADSGGADAKQHREDVQDVAREVYAYITVLTEAQTPETAKRAMGDALFYRAPEWTLLTTAAICAWRWQRLATKFPRVNGRRPKLPRAQLARSGGPADDPTLVGDYLKLVETMSRSGAAHSPDAKSMIDDMVAAKRGPNAFLVLLEIALDLALLLVERSPMVIDHRDLIRQESLRVESDYMSRFGPK